MAHSYIGAFYMELLSDGIISSIYNNTVATKIHPETAKYIKPNKNNQDTNFCAIYKTVWLEEPDNNHEDAILEIIREADQSYKLLWYNEKNTAEIYYHGIGFMKDGFLVGAYWTKHLNDSVIKNIST